MLDFGSEIRYDSSMKMIKYLPLLCALFLVGCDTVKEKGEVISFTLVDDNKFALITKTSDNELRNYAIIHYGTVNDTSHIYCDVKEGEPMWYEGDRYVDIVGFANINIHVRSDKVGVGYKKESQ
jgi:hypothetical protein